jgi:hypothetical protein
MVWAEEVNDIDIGPLSTISGSPENMTNLIIYVYQREADNEKGTNTSVGIIHTEQGFEQNMIAVMLHSMMV